jgi:nitrogen regulatory protein P-II 1
MQYKKVTAIVVCEKLKAVEQALVEIGVSGVSITQVRGYGEYHDFYQSDMMTCHACIDVFCRASRADIIVNTIMDAAHNGQPEDGIIAVMPVEQLYRIRTKSDYDADVTD